MKTLSLTVSSFVSTSFCLFILGDLTTFWDSLSGGPPSVWCEIDLEPDTKKSSHFTLQYMVLNVLILMFDKINMSVLVFYRCIFKLSTSLSWMSLPLVFWWFQGVSKEISAMKWVYGDASTQLKGISHLRKYMGKEQIQILSAFSRAFLFLQSSQ